jgi:hypothetical protein
MAWYRCIGGSSSSTKTTVLQDGKISDGTAKEYRQAEFSDISDFDFIVVTLRSIYEGTEYTSEPLVVNSKPLPNNYKFYCDPNSGDIHVQISSTSITGTGYPGSWKDIYADIVGYSNTIE